MEKKDLELINDHLVINRPEMLLYITMYGLINLAYKDIASDIFDNKDISKLIVYNKSRNITRETIFIKESEEINKLSEDQKEFIYNIEDAYIIYYLNSSIINSNIYINNTSLFIPNGYHKAINKYCTNKNLSSIDTELIHIVKSLYFLCRYINNGDGKTDIEEIAKLCDSYCRDELSSKLNKPQLRELITEDNKVQLKNQLNSYIVKFVNEISYKDYYNKKAFNNNDDIIIDYICDILNYIIEEVNMIYHILKYSVYFQKTMINGISFGNVLNLFIRSVYKKELDVYIKTIFVDLINEIDEEEVSINIKEPTHKTLSIEEHREGCLRYNMEHNTGKFGSTQACTNCLIGKLTVFEDNTQKIICDLSKLEKEE